MNESKNAGFRFVYSKTTYITSKYLMNIEGLLNEHVRQNLDFLQLYAAKNSYFPFLLKLLRLSVI